MEGTGNEPGGGRHRPPRRLGEGRLCYTIPEAAKLIGVSRNQGYELANRGELPIVKFGKRKFVPKAPFHKIFGLNEESENASI